MNFSPTCTFCDKQLKPLTWTGYYKCENHYPVKVMFKLCKELPSPLIGCLDKNIFEDIFLNIDKYTVSTVNSKILSYMLFFNGICWSELPVDPNLTPENFEQKIKTYLTFQ